MHSLTTNYHYENGLKWTETIPFMEKKEVKNTIANFIY